MRFGASAAPSPEGRRAVVVPLWTGLRAIDGLLTLGRGARLGVFGAAGTGKSVLLETIARGARSDALVIALVGERGREAQTWLAHVDPRTTLVCATSDRSPAERIRAAEVAFVQANALRAAGLHVTLVFDSIARYVDALREQRVALGEPVGQGGYPAGVWLALARLLERAGTTERGSMTLLATFWPKRRRKRPVGGSGALVARRTHRPIARAGASRPVSRRRRFGERQPDDGRRRRRRHLGAAAQVRATLALLAESEDFAPQPAGRRERSALRRALEAQPAIEAFLRQRDP